jgi:toxin ParE1/3/4
MNHKVRLTQEAKENIRAISDYIAHDSISNARRWEIGLRQRLRTLKDFPERCEIAFPASKAGRDVRHTFFGVYQVLYEIAGDTVMVLAVRHGARRPLSPDEVRRLA